MILFVIFMIFFMKKILKKSKRKIIFLEKYIFVVIGDVSTTEPPFITCLIYKKNLFNLAIIIWIMNIKWTKIMDSNI